MSVDKNDMQPDSQWSLIQQRLVRGRAAKEGEEQNVEQVPVPVSAPAPVERSRKTVRERKAKADASLSVRKTFDLSVDFNRKLNCVLAAKGLEFSALVRKLLEDYVSKSLKEDFMKEFFSDLK